MDDQLATNSEKRKLSLGRRKVKDKSKVAKEVSDLDSGLSDSPQQEPAKDAGFDLDSQCDVARTSTDKTAPPNKPRNGAPTESAILDPIFASIGKGLKLSKVKRMGSSANAVEQQVNLDNILDTVDEETSVALSSVAGTQGSLPNDPNTDSTGYSEYAATASASKERSNTHTDLDHTDLDHYTPPTMSSGKNATESACDAGDHKSVDQHRMHQKSLHDIPLGQPEAPLELVKVNKTLSTSGKSQTQRISRRPLLPVAITIACCLFGALTLLILGFNFLFTAEEEELYLCGVCPVGMEPTVSSFVFESNSTAEIMLGLSCDDLESMANGGVFSKKECTIVNHLAKEACGCRVLTESPTVSPSPTTDPTRAPTGAPTNVRTGSPTTLAPSTAAPTGIPTTLAPSSAAPTSQTAAPMLYTPSPLPPTPPFVAMSQNRDYDRFNYRDTEAYSTYNDFGPKDWGEIRCDDQENCVSFALHIARRCTDGAIC